MISLLMLKIVGLMVVIGSVVLVSNKLHPSVCTGMGTYVNLGSLLELLFHVEIGLSRVQHDRVLV